MKNVASASFTKHSGIMLMIRNTAIAGGFLRLLWMILLMTVDFVSQLCIAVSGVASSNQMTEIKRVRGRPPAPPTLPISIRVTVEQNEAYKAAGGAKWLKALLDKQIKKRK